MSVRSNVDKHVKKSGGKAALPGSLHGHCCWLRLRLLIRRDMWVEKTKSEGRKEAVSVLAAEALGSPAWRKQIAG